MDVFRNYVQNLERIVLSLTSNSADPVDRSLVPGILNGQPADHLRRVASLEQLRDAGVFFTPVTLAEHLVTSLSPTPFEVSTVLDPTCGSGDLLLAYARYLPVAKTLRDTIEIWGHALHGSDIYPQFVRATKARLILLALSRGAEVTAPIASTTELLPNIVVRDTLSATNAYRETKQILINPPYTIVTAPDDCSWTTGIVSQAALHVEACVKNAPPGTRIAAILPDVLRTGSRYLNWRTYIEQYAKVDSVEIVGRFDKYTDIDVFITRLIVGESSTQNQREWWETSQHLPVSVKTIDDFFDVRVGPVVPHRHPESGPEVPYIFVGDLPPWEIFEANSSYRRFSGTTFVPPFVAIRRTSRPDYEYRAIGTIVTGGDPVAVENHLIVVRPKSGSIEDCKRLLDNLRAPMTNVWFNERIRCRHLTVGAVRNLPWWPEQDSWDAFG